MHNIFGFSLGTNNKHKSQYTAFPYLLHTKKSEKKLLVNCQLNPGHCLWNFKPFLEIQ